MEGSILWRIISLENLANVNSVEGSIPLPSSKIKVRTDFYIYGSLGELVYPLVLETKLNCVSVRIREELQQ